MSHPGTRLLPFHGTICSEMARGDGLLVTAHGLGMERIAASLLAVHCSVTEALVVVLNMPVPEQEYIIDSFRHSDEVKRLPKVIDADMQAAERHETYLAGGNDRHLSSVNHGC